MKRIAWTLFLAAVLIPHSALAQSGDTVIYYHTDAIGSVRMITDANGAEIARYDFLPFGEPWPPPQTPQDVRQFTGKERDPETKLDYFGARYYRSDSARFITVDPVLNPEKAVVDPQLWNRYAYAVNNPFKYVDPDGRAVLKLFTDPAALARAGTIRDAVASALGDSQHPLAIFGRNVVDSFLSTLLPRDQREVIENGNASILGIAGVLEAAPIRITSAISKNKGLVRMAEEAGKSVQVGLDSLTKQLAQGNLNPGIGTKNLFGSVFYARARDGARVFFRQVGDTIEILAKASKDNEARVISKLQELYR